MWLVYIVLFLLSNSIDSFIFKKIIWCFWIVPEIVKEFYSPQKVFHFNNKYNQILLFWKDRKINKFKLITNFSITVLRRDVRMNKYYCDSSFLPLIIFSISWNDFPRVSHTKKMPNNALSTQIIPNPNIQLYSPNDWTHTLYKALKMNSKTQNIATTIERQIWLI